MRDEFFPLNKNEVLIIKGSEGALAILKAGDLNKVYIESLESEIEFPLDPEDIIVAFCFGNNEKVVRGLKCMLFLIREQGLPLIAFPRNHKLSMPIRILVSIGKHIILSCRIPPVIKSSLLCTSKEFDGMEIVAKEGGVIIKGLKDFAIFRTQYNNTFPF